MAMGTTVFRIRIELIFRWCWNLITPSRSCTFRVSRCGFVGASRRHFGARKPNPVPAALLESCRGHSAHITDLPGYAGASVMRAADDPAEQFGPQLGVRTAEIEGREKHRVKRKPTAEEGSQD
jgi:hypothetical protein